MKKVSQSVVVEFTPLSFLFVKKITKIWFDSEINQDEQILNFILLIIVINVHIDKQ